MMVLLIILLLLVLLCITPVGAKVYYSAEGPKVYLKAGPISILVFPRPKKEKTPKQLQKEARKAAEKAEKKEKAAVDKAAGVEKPREPIGGKIEFFKELLGVGLSALGCIKRKLIMKDLVLYLTVGGQGEDAAKAALLYGRAWAAVGALTPVLENTFRIKNRDIQVGIDFLAPDNVVYAEATVLFRIGDLLWIAIYHGIRALKILLRQKRKGRKKNGTSHQ